MAEINYQQKVLPNSLFKAMSANTLEMCLQNESNFIGCFSKSNLPKFPSNLPCSMIVKVNSDEFSHWVAIKMTETNVFYFDSFANNAGANEIYNFLAPHYTRIIFNTKCIQHRSSVTCGLFCIAFLLSVDSKESFVKFLNIFMSHRKKENDNLALNLVCCKLNYNIYE